MRLSAPIYQLKRRAKLIARDEKIALHEALNRVAREEGYAEWSLLSSQTAMHLSSKTMLSRLADGDMLLVGARPGHGKTLLGLELLLAAARQGRKGVFFTLEYTQAETWQRIRRLGGDAVDLGNRLEIVTSDEICADYIMHYLSSPARGTVAVIDYLQILDQRRTKPPLSDQMLALRDFARKTGIVLAFISQIDRSFDPEQKPVPDLRDVRLPNPVDLKFFTKACFLHSRKAQLQEIA